MTIAYWCVFIIFLFPYFFTTLAKCSTRYNNHDPRVYLEQTAGWRRRAHYVQLNSFEALPPFGLAVIFAYLSHGSQTTIDLLSILFVVARICYSICYLCDQATLRSIFWFIGIGCVVGLFMMAI